MVREEKPAPPRRCNPFGASGLGQFTRHVAAPTDMGEKAQTHMTGHAAALGFSGGLAGGIAKTAVAPLERVKLLMQTGESQGVTVTLRKVVHHEGFGALWRGNTVNVMRMVPSKCVLLSCSDLYKDALGLTHMSAFAQGGIAGAFAGATAALCTYPLDLARTRMAGMLHSGGMASTQHGALATLVNIYQNEGVRALYRGASPTVLGALPYEGIKFGTYDLLKRHARPLPSGSAPGERSSGGPLWRACCGATAAMIAHVLTYPNDTIRRVRLASMIPSCVLACPRALR